MWKRLQGHVRDKDKQIGNPVLVDTTYDEDHLRQIPTVSDAQNASYQTHPLPPSAEPQPYNSLSPPDPRGHRSSDVPTVSSTYSQLSPDPRYDYHPSASGPEISPPSSPEAEQQDDRSLNQPRRFRSMRDVSPVDENRGAPPGASNIPVLRKAPPELQGSQAGGSQKFWNAKVAPNSKVRWDEYSGEPTSSSAGKASQVNPKSYVPATERRPMGYQVSVTGPQEPVQKPATFSERAMRFGTKPAPVDTFMKPREPWRGASGRAEIVQPFKDRRSKQLPKLQRKTGPKTAGTIAEDAPTSAADTFRRVPGGADTSPVADDRDGLDELDTHEDPIKPIVPLKVGRNSPPRSLASPTSPHNPGLQAPYSYPSPITPTDVQPLSPVTNEQGDAKSGTLHSNATPANTKIVRKSIEGTPGSTPSKDHGPASRFSWTTYNTNTTYQQSPPPSPPPPLPPQDPVSAAASILNRRRPVPSTDKVTTRKPVTPGTASIRVMSSGPPSPRPDSTFSTNTQKALPRPPTEISAADHVDILEAQLDDLRLRRSNVHRLLSDLNQRMPANPLITNFKRMRLVEQRKKDFEEELAEIKKEEHDVGLKLHRAWRKRERADPNGSESALWIRRVTR